jgi:pyruvate dehydrogenase E2 component (dihydrolipoamide acetyltransferase)
MRKFLCVLALSIVAGTGWFFWPRISTELETRFPKVVEKRAELNSPAPESAETPSTAEVETAPEPKTVTEAAAADSTAEAPPEAAPTEAAPAQAAPEAAPSEAAPAEVPATKTSMNLEGNEAQAWF